MCKFTLFGVWIKENRQGETSMDKTELKYMRKELPDDFGFLKL